MALGFRKKKDEGDQLVAESTDQTAAAPADRGRKRKPNERLSSVVKESAPGAAVDLLSRNTEFVLPQNAGWLVLLLNVEAPSFGGLSIKHKGDEAKGSIIELITADHIEVVVTAEMLEEDILGIIPRLATLDRMAEYSLLTGAPYIWGVITQSEDGSLQAAPVADATFAQAREIARAKTTVADELPEIWAWAQGDGEAAGQVESSQEDFYAVEAHVGLDQDQEQVVDEHGFDDSSEAPFGADEGEAVWQEPEATEQVNYVPQHSYDPEDAGAVDYESMAEGGFDGGEEVFYDEGDGDPFAGLEDEREDADQGTDQSYQEYVTKNYEREVDIAEVRDTIARRLSSEDLQLDIDVDVVRKSLATTVPAVTIEVPNSDAWLADQVADLTRQANAQIAKQAVDDAAELERQYVQLMSMHAEKVTRDMSVANSSTQYSELMRAAKVDFESAKEESAEDAAKQRSAISGRFESEADDAARAAADAAKARFHAQNRSLRERLLAEVDLAIEAKAEERYAHARDVVLRMRRQDAALAMDLGSTRALQLLDELRSEQVKAQTELLHSWNERIVSFIDANRKDDVARTQTLAEKLARENQIEDLMAAFAREREELATKSSARERELEQQMVAVREKALAELNEREAAWSHNLELEAQKTASAHGLVSKLEEQMGSLGATLEARHASRIAELVSDKESYGAELERANHIQSRANKIMTVLVVVLTLAALAVGVIIGWAWALNNAGATGMAVLSLLPGLEQLLR